MLYYFLILGAIIALQFVLEYFLAGILHMDYIFVMLIINFVIAIVFSMFNYRGRPKLSNPRFHSSIAMYFTLFTIFNVLSMLMR